MPRLIWTPRALADTDRLYRFLATKNRDAARRAIAAIRERVGVLKRHPQAGRPVEEMTVEYREWPVPFGSAGYVVLYHYDQEKVVILAVRHAREIGY